MSWTAIVILAAGSYLFKALGVLVLGPAAGAGHPDRAAGDGPALRIGRLLPPALLAALVVSQTVVTDGQLVLDARLVGVAAGALAVWRRAPFWLVLLVAAAATAAVRQLAG